MLTGELLDRLQRHYVKPSDPLPGGLFIPECGWNGGGTSRADALYVGFTTTSGRILVGHELKVSKADWQHELDQPGKADQWADQCHAWYVVAPSIEIVDPATVPADWGLMVPSARSKTRMQIVKAATVHRDRTPSWQAVRSILARADTLRAQAISGARQKLDEDYRIRLRELQAQARSGELVAVHPQAKLVAQIIGQVSEQLDSPWRSVDVDLVVATLVDAQRVRDLTEETRRELESLTYTARQLAEPMKRTQKLLAELPRPTLDVSA